MPCCCCARKSVRNLNNVEKRPWPPEGPGKMCVCRSYPNLVERKPKFCQPPPPKPFLLHFHKPPKTHMSHDTVYKMSYQPIEDSRVTPPAKKKVDANVNRKMESNTTHRMSYQENKGIRPRSPYRPCRKDLLGRGPAQSITTHRHDYVPQPFMREPPFTLKNYSIPPTHMNHVTVNRHDFTWPEYSKPTSLAKKPEDAPSKAHISEKTIHRMSYCPFSGAVQAVPKKRVDINSRARISANTVYNMSYGPGLECGEEEIHQNLCSGGCKCSYPGKCLNIPENGSYSVCCCHCPKAGIA